MLFHYYDKGSVLTLYLASIQYFFNSVYDSFKASSGVLLDSLIREMGLPGECTLCNN